MIGGSKCDSKFPPSGIVEAHRLDICLIILGVIPLFLAPQLDVEDSSWGISFEKLLVVRGLRLFRLVRVLRMLSNFKLVWRLVYSLFAAGLLFRRSQILSKKSALWFFIQKINWLKRTELNVFGTWKFRSFGRWSGSLFGDCIFEMSSPESIREPRGQTILSTTILISVSLFLAANVAVELIAKDAFGWSWSGIVPTVLVTYKRRP